ncbi:hypothetical protein ABXN37_13685 [Piscinibacter sakaiensis]|uniref:ABM domain-containing protein n=1 Tax=Piscinibacter sakaiensis TaxID=1547922 RepID=A0A0K8P0Z4_PISS1|nr:hypothetical protein [Piscinibacter sakaiensis]GAP36204.1 hypothetical protein ISF6_2044 [Piscinibacter sakaiensis]
MGRTVICAYRPKRGHETELLGLVAEHLPLLQSRGLANGHAGCRMRAPDGTVVEVFQWRSAAAIEEAHGDPDVQALWARFARACDYVPLNTLPECSEMFAEFDPLP